MPQRRRVALIRPPSGVPWYLRQRSRPRTNTWASKTSLTSRPAAYEASRGESNSHLRPLSILELGCGATRAVPARAALPVALAGHHSPTTTRRYDRRRERARHAAAATLVIPYDPHPETTVLRQNSPIFHAQAYADAQHIARLGREPRCNSVVQCPMPSSGYSHSRPN